MTVTHNDNETIIGRTEINDIDAILAIPTCDPNEVEHVVKNDADTIFAARSYPEVTFSQSDYTGTRERLRGHQLCERLLSLASPLDLYESPGTAYVANFLGQSNLLRAVVSERSEDAVVVEEHAKPVVGAGLRGVVDDEAVIAAQVAIATLASPSSTRPVRWRSARR